MVMIHGLLVADPGLEPRLTEIVGSQVGQGAGAFSRILLPPSERGPSAPVPSNLYENWAGVDIMSYLDGGWRRQSLVYFGNS